jgi:hypothetical protein
MAKAEACSFANGGAGTKVDVASTTAGSQASRESGVENGASDGTRDVSGELPGLDVSKKDFQLMSEVAFGMWSKSRIQDAGEFERKLREVLPQGTELHGCQEEHDGQLHYHAVMGFPERAHMRNAPKRFPLTAEDGKVDAAAVRIAAPHIHQRVNAFLEVSQARVCKGNNLVMVGEDIGPRGGLVGRKRKFHDAVKEPHSKATKQMGKPVLHSEKRHETRGGWSSDELRLQPWIISREMSEWQRAHLGERVPSGRVVPLILVGMPRLGKTEWAERVGERPLKMSVQWNIAEYDINATHVVLNNMNFGKFKYWREVLGCETGFYLSRTRYIKWGFPLIVTCNADNDPRRIPKIAAYIEEVGCVVVELDKPLF